MSNTYTNFQLSTSKTDLTNNRSEMGAILPPGTLPLGELGGGYLIFLNLLHMRDIHTDFQLPIFITVNFSVWGAILPLNAPYFPP